MARSVMGTGHRTARSVRELARGAASQLPRLARLDQIQPTTRISLGLLVEERQRRAPDDHLLPVRGPWLYSAGCQPANRQHRPRFDLDRRAAGRARGVLMTTRPSALVLSVALSRLGAVSVMLRPDGDVSREAALGQIQRIIADPERAPVAAGLGHGHTFVLGGGRGPRDLGIPLSTDMEQIDPGAVPLPKWCRRNPGRAGDIALIMFTGEGTARV
jgi:putative long chain acyl-CoA synthase